MTGTLDSDFLQKQRTALEVEKSTLEGELARIARKDPVGDDYHTKVEQVGRAEDENATEEEQYEAARSVEQNLELKLKDVNAALQRMRDGSYGVCGVCRTPIDQKRLEALASAPTCRDHAQ